MPVANHGQKILRAVGANGKLRNFVSGLGRPLANQRGVALLMALFATTVMLILAVELTYETNVDYQVSAQHLNRLKSYYAARAGLEIALLRIKVYMGISGQLKGANEMVKQMVPMHLVDMIWQMPFVWPPPVSDDISGVDKDNIQKSVSESYMEAQYTVSVSAQSGRIDFNDLASPSKSLAKSVRDQILAMLQQKLIDDEEFGRKYRGYRFEELINNITDWVDADTESLNGGDERNHYRDLPASVKFIPPNQPFRTPEEMHMVAKMTDDLYDILMSVGTIHGIRGINVNYSDQQQLQSLHPRMTPEIAQEIIKRRMLPGPFNSLEEFINFLRAKGLDTRYLESAEAVPLYFDPEIIFRVSSTGTFGKSVREIVALVYDFDRVKENFEKAIAKDKPKDGEGTAGDGKDKKSDKSSADSSKESKNDTSTSTSARSGGRPNIIFWQED